MALAPRLELRQAQTLVMTPQLQQAIKMLQLSNLDLAAYVDQELERNPLLERADPEGGSDAAPREERESVATEPMLEAVDLTTGRDAGDVAEQALDVDVDNQFNNDSDAGGPTPADGGTDSTLWREGGGGYDGEVGPGLEQTLSSETNLREHLLSQIGMEITDPGDRIIAAFLLEQLDECGYFTGDLEAIAQQIGADPTRVTGVLIRLQHFDPPGIFARNLAECLAIQLAERDRLDPAMQKFLENLPLLARRDYRALARLCGVDEDDVFDMAAEIRALDPRPAQAWDAVVAAPVIPDVLMRADGKGGWIVELNQDTLPRVLVNNSYMAEISGSARTREDKKYIADCLQSANWLVRALHQRATTILKVATEIVKLQDGFFLKGVEGLRPLVLRDVADAIEMHESTVSRVTNNKFIATPRGLFELKYFFTTALGNADGGAMHSAEAVRHRIKTLVDGEPASKVLSDDRIVGILRGEGIDIARRTVAKYREALGIPSSVQRRREKAVRQSR
ncbi:MAG: RNA polymerase factor sigma-54 [Magnetospiraceae bacterium]